MKVKLLMFGILNVLFVWHGTDGINYLLPESFSGNVRDESNNTGPGIQTVSEQQRNVLEVTGIYNSVSSSLSQDLQDDLSLTNQEDENIILISVVPDLMKFDKEVFTVVAGQEVIIELDNPDGMQHNLVISKPGTLKEVGAAADALARDPKGAEKQYVPEIPAVLFATKMLDPGEFVTLTFTAPSEPGDYPFICTFPGHWRMMNGIMKVTE